MKSLAQFQREVLHAIAMGESVPDAKSEAHWKADTAARFHVYVDGYRARYEESLLDAFPATARFLGHQAFHRLSEAYAAAHRSTHWDLSRVGWNWSEFLAAQPEAQQFPFLPDLARFEWMLHAIFFAMDTGAPATFPVEPDALAAWRPQFSPTVHVFRSIWPIKTLRDAEEAPLKDEKPHVGRTAECVLVGRTPEGEVLTLLLPEPQADLQEKLLAGLTLGDAIETVPALTEEHVSSLTKFWVSAKLIR